MYYNYRGNCSRVFNGDWDVAEAITEEEFNAALEMHENPSNPMPLTFIPIEQ